MLSITAPISLLRHAASAGIILALSAVGLNADDEGKPEQPPTQRELVDMLTQSNLQETFRILLRDYIQHDQLSHLEINRAALEGILDRLGLGAELVPRSSENGGTAAEFKSVSELLKGDIGYFRPAGFDKEAAAEADAVIEKFKDSKTLILDLRTPMPDADFGGTTGFLSRFCPSNTVLFKIRKPDDSKPRVFLSKNAKRWSGELILLVDPDTSNVAETVAAVINHFNETFVVGEQTAGRTVQYQRVNIGDGTALRFAVAEVVMPDDTSHFQKGIEPHLVSRTKLETKRSVFEKSAKEGVAKFIYDRERPFLSEAALVAGTNPELPLELAKTAGKPSEFDHIPLQDRTLQQAVELITARRFLNSKE